MSSHHSVKQLQTRKAKLVAERDRLQAERDTAARAMKQCDKEISEVATQIKLATANPVVSEHALLRYIERKLGVDLKACRREILTDKLAEAIQTLGSGKYPIGDGMKAVVKQNVVVSVIGGE